MLIKNISLINNNASIDFSAATINLPNISTSKYTFSNFPISGGTLNFTTLNLGSASRTILSGSNISNLSSLSLDCGSLKINNTTVNSQNGIDITLNTGSGFWITGSVSALTTNYMTLTSCCPLQSDWLSGSVSTRTLTFNVQKMDFRQSVSISTTNNYTLSFGTSGDQNYRLVRILLWLENQIVWDFYTINLSEDRTFDANFKMSSKTHYFTMTIKADNRIIYNHDGTPPSGLELYTYTSPFQIDL